jgi:hypothetical protein
MNQRLHSLTNQYFILSLIILLTNDFYLKYQYHNWITGKLSDVAGLFVFVYFWAAFFPRQKRIICIVTGLAFVYWKSAYSQPFINAFSENIYTIGRTIDGSDLLALFAIPIAYSVRQDAWAKVKMESTSIPIAIVTIFSFCATSIPIPTQVFDRPEYVLFRMTEFDFIDNYPSEFRVHNVDSMEVISVTRIQTEKFSPLEDGYCKSQILTDLDLRVLRASEGNYKGTDLSLYRALRDSLTIIGPTSITLDLDSVSEELNFRGTRLDGPYRRYSKRKEIVIDGRYKRGIPDSIWIFNDNNTGAVTRQQFVAGELTMIERIKDGKIVTKHVSTRKDFITKQYLIISGISFLLVLLVIKLVLNFRAPDGKILASVSSYEKIGQIIFLPTVIFIVGKVLSGFILDSQSDMFQILRQFILTNGILIPAFALVFYGIRLRTRFDVILYVLLFVLALVWLEEYFFLKSVLI